MPRTMMTADLQASSAYAENAAQLRLAGSRVRPFASRITRERQAAYHAAAGIPPERYGDHVDASLLAIDAMLSINYTNEIAQGGLHAGHRVMQSRPVHHDEALTLVGTVTEARPMRLGTLITIDIDVRRVNGEVPVQLKFHSLRLHAAQPAGPGGAAPSADTLAGYTLLSEQVLDPVRVAAYSYEFPEAWVHFDAQKAAQLGLRAPLAHGAMSLTWIAGEIARHGAVQAMDLSVTFRRPIFWDEQVKVYQDKDKRFAVVNSAGIHCTTGWLGMVRYADPLGHHADLNQNIFTT